MGFNLLANLPGVDIDLQNDSDTGLGPQATIQATAPLVKQATYAWY